MTSTRLLTAGFALLLVGAPASDALAQDVDSIASEEIELPARRGMKKTAPKRSYFLIGPRAGAKAPASGYGLLIVLPGGNGGRGFHTFVKRIYANALGDDWLAAQPIAIDWARSKQLVWPTRKDAVRGEVTGTELFVEDVVTDTAKRHAIDPARVYLLAWSSGGPAAYAISLQKKKSVTGFFIAMSVFRPSGATSLREARGEAFYLLHSPADTICPYRMAQNAESTLRKVGASVVLRTYEGGHGWHGDVYGSLREGCRWLDEHRAPADEAMWPASRSSRSKTKGG